MATVSLFASTDRDQQILEFLIRFLGLETSCQTQKEVGAQSRLESETLKLQGISTICRYLVSLSGVYEPASLLGATSQESAQISEWISLCLNGTGHGDHSYHRMNTHLESRMFLVGQRLTLADLLCYVAVNPIAVAFPVAQYGHFCNLIRWHDYIQSTFDCTPSLSSVKRKLPTFDFSTPAKRQLDGGSQQEKKEQIQKRAKPQQSTASSAAPKSNGAEQPPAKSKKEKNPKEGKEKKPEESKKKLEPQIDMLDMRVGKIVSVKQHPDADSLFIEEIDLGEEKHRQVISGLVKFVPIESMQNRMVVVCCNLKPAKMRGIQSAGMVMCASNSDKTEVEPLVIPEAVPLGERIMFTGYENDPLEEIKPKQKILEALLPELKTDASGVATYKGTPFMTSKGPLTSRIANGSVS